jgi:hypothetical protein
VIGFAYGISLSVIGTLLAAAGHGTYLLLGLASAPFGLLGITVSIVCPPFLWSAILLALSYAGKTRYRIIATTFLVVHYLGIILVFFDRDYMEVKYIRRIGRAYPVTLVMSFALYLAGEVAIWLCWCTMRRQSNSTISVERRGQKC